MDASPPDVVVIGDLVTDVSVQTSSAAPAPGSDTAATILVGDGGSGGNTAAWLHEAGVRAGLVTRVGDDVHGRALVDRLRRSGVQVAAATDVRVHTGAVVAMIAGDAERTMLADRGACAMLAASDLPVGWFRAGAHLHVSGYALFDLPGRHGGMAAVRRAVAVGMSVSIDPASWAPLRRVGAQRFRALAAGARLWLPNLDEARVLTGTGDPSVAARALATGGAEVVVTCGAAGAVWSDGTAVRRVGAPAGAVVDTTGAGDAFAAGYLAARLGGEEAVEALDRGVALAARAVGRVGARPRG